MRCVPDVVLYKPRESDLPTLSVYIIGECAKGQARRCERVDGYGAHVRASIVECSKESRRALGARPEMLLKRKRKEEGVNTCYLAKVFPSGWNENASLYTKRRSPEARARRIRFQSRANLSIGCVPRIFHDAELCGANSAQ